MEGQTEPNTLHGFLGSGWHQKWCRFSTCTFPRLLVTGVVSPRETFQAVTWGFFFVNCKKQGLWKKGFKKCANEFLQKVSRDKTKDKTPGPGSYVFRGKKKYNFSEARPPT